MTFPPGGQRYSAVRNVQQSSSKPLLLIGAIVLGAGLVAGCSSASGSTGTGKTDEQRIESAVRDFYQTLSKEGPAAAAAKACAPDRTEYQALSAAQQKAAEQGRFEIHIDAVSKIAVTGDRGTAEMKGTVALPGADGKQTTGTEHLRKEDGGWKVCSSDGK
ncbi:Rv0361 family membrane protein [Nocardia inohanensis]|uniref:Rv0361 family membrane protein n=1 Tax=Nocardia inohanensis TaxID=209246 RepID=UPI0008327014|nr:hypothetical protein [Nocardia inohanensis]